MNRYPPELRSQNGKQMKTIQVIPELNHWLSKFLLNNPYSNFSLKTPTVISDYWEAKNSVLSLLFNENFHPSTPGYITDYRKCNIRSITDKKLLSRINIYRGRVEVYVNDDDAFWDIFDMRNSIGNSNEFVMDLNMQEVEKNLKGVSYSNEKYFTTNYPLVKATGADSDFGTGETQPPILNDPINIFEITAEDSSMLDLLYSYKMDSPVDLSGVEWASLTSPLQKLIYIYLDFCINQSLVHYEDRHKITDGSNILHSVYEKYVCDFIYSHFEKQYGVIYRPIKVVNDKQVEINRDYFMIMKCRRISLILTQQNIDDEKISFTDKIPWDRVDFTLFKKGSKALQDKVYKVTIDATDPENPFFILKFLNNSFEVGEKLVLIWSYVEPYGALSQDLNKPELSDPQISDLENEVVLPTKPDTYNLM